MRRDVSFSFSHVMKQIKFTLFKKQKKLSRQNMKLSCNMLGLVWKSC